MLLLCYSALVPTQPQETINGSILQNLNDQLDAIEHQLATHVGSSDDDGDAVRRHRREICLRRQNIGDIDASVKVVGERLSDVESRIEKVDQFVDETVSSLTTMLAVEDIGTSQVTSENLKVRKCVCFAFLSLHNL